MTTIVQKPSPINLSGNLPEFILFSDNSVNFVLKTGNNELFSSTYTPGSNRKIIINVKELIESVLIFQFRDILEIYTQDTLVGNFTAYINDEKIADFKVIKGGVSNFGMTAETFLQQHFLTWQPRNKKISYSSPEYLSYYAIADCRIKLKAYISNTLSESVETTELVLSELKEGNIYTIPMMYAYISGKLNKYPSSYDVWIESTDGSIRYSYIQRYEYEQRKSEQEEFIIFENSLGGIDCFRAYGNTVFNAENTHNIATINEQLNEYRIDTEYKYTKNTGYLNQYEMKWLKDFFPSTGKYIFKDNILRKIVITEDNVSSSEQDAVGSYEFTYKYADDNIYLNLPINQNSNTLISPMSIQSDNIDTILDLEPRMAEFPMQKLSEGSLFPVQEPFSERWHATNAGAIANYIIDKINQLTDGRLLDNRFKGYFLTETSLKESYPNPLYGDSAWVGEPFPGVVYTVENGEWKTSGKAPEFGDVKLEDYATKEELTELGINVNGISNRINKTNLILSDLMYAYAQTGEIVDSSSDRKGIFVAVDANTLYTVENLIALNNAVVFYSDYPTKENWETAYIGYAIISDNTFTTPEKTKWAAFTILNENINDSPIYCFSEYAVLQSLKSVLYLIKNNGNVRTYTIANRDNLTSVGTYVLDSTIETNASIMLVSNVSGIIQQTEFINLTQNKEYFFRTRFFENESWSPWENYYPKQLKQLVESIQDTIKERFLYSQSINNLIERQNLAPFGYISTNGGGGKLVNATPGQNSFVIKVTPNAEYFFDGFEIVNSAILYYSDYPTVENSQDLYLGYVLNPNFNESKKFVVEKSDNTNIADDDFSKIKYALLVYNVDTKQDICTCFSEDARLQNKQDVLTLLGNTENVSYPKSVVKWIKTDNKFEVYMQSKPNSNIYFMLGMVLDETTDDMIYLKEWRLRTTGGVYEYNRGTFTSLNKKLLYGNENELAFQFEGKADFTGGVHGDERIDISSDSFAKFFIDGVELTEEELQSDFTKKCAEFYLLQCSSLHDTTTDGESIIEGHPIIGTHYKKTIISDCGYKTTNKVIFDFTAVGEEQRKIKVWFAGLCCVANDCSQYVYGEDYNIITTDDSGTEHDLGNILGSEIEMWSNNNKLRCLVKSKVFTEDDTKCTIMIWDRNTDTKYYRYAPTRVVKTNDVFKSEMEVRYSIFVE